MACVQKGRANPREREKGHFWLFFEKLIPQIVTLTQIVTLFWPHDNVTIMSGDSISHLRSFFQPNLYIFVIGLSEKQNPSIVPKSLSSKPLQCITVKKFGNPSESNVIQCSSTDGFNELKSILNSKAHSGLFIF